MNSGACERLGIEVPIILAPMGGAVGPNLAAAVSNAGGLGILPVWRAEIDTLRTVVRQTKALTEQPFAVNLNMDFPQEERLEASLDEGVPIISFFWRDPSPLVRKAKDAGAIVLHTVANAEEARRAVDCGVDILVAQGWEAGGHVRGTVATLPLVPAVIDAIGDVPVVAAGGIADGRGLAAVLALGASAAWIGTRFLASEEVEIHPEYRKHIFAASENDTIHLENLFDGTWPNAPHRTLRNSTVEAWEAAGRPPSGERPGEGEVIAVSPSRGDIVRYQCYTPRPDAEGNIEAASMWAGQGVSMVRHAQPAAQIVREITREAEARLRELAMQCDLQT
jgi:NAD(P)H-dependent flavin oxidoreductase YrpB (nitropropane dioxygenase family)